MKTYRGAGIAFFRQKDGRYEVFLGKRKHNPGKGKWSFAGGGMDARDGGDFLATAKRETEEEMNKAVDNLAASPRGSFHINLGFYRWETFFYLLNSPETGDGFRFYHEMDPWGWFPLSALPAMRNELYEAEVPVIRLRIGMGVFDAVEEFKKSLV